MTEATQTWLTQEAFDRLKAEYEHLKGEGRAAIAKEIDERRQEGDLKENGGYHAAREEQAKQEARIEQLRHLLDTAVVGEGGQFDGTVSTGTVVTADVAGRSMKFLVGSREVAEGTGLDVFSPQSPLGSAVMAARAGDTVEYEAPNGKQISVTITHVEAFEG